MINPYICSKRRHQSGGRDRSLAFISFLLEQLRQDHPQLLDEANFIFNNYKRQVAGYKGLSIIIKQLSVLVGDKYWSKVYFDFLRSWNEYPSRVQSSGLRPDKYPDRHHKSKGSIFRTAIQKNHSQNFKKCSLKKSQQPSLVDLTSSFDTVGKDNTNTVVTSCDYKAGTVGHKSWPFTGKQVTKEISSMSYDKPYSNIRAANAPVNSPVYSGINKFKPHIAKSSSNAGPCHSSIHCIPQPREKLENSVGDVNRNAEQLSVETSKQPMDLSDLLARMKIQIKQDQIQSIVFVARILYKLKDGSYPFKYHQQAISIIQDTLERHQQQEIGYEILSTKLQERIKALMIQIEEQKEGRTDHQQGNVNTDVEMAAKTTEGSKMNNTAFETESNTNDDRKPSSISMDVEDNDGCSDLHCKESFDYDGIDDDNPSGITEQVHSTPLSVLQMALEDTIGIDMDDDDGSIVV